MIRIKCDGVSPVPANVSITDQSGRELTFITAIQIFMQAEKANYAKIDVDNVEFIDVQAEPMLSFDSLKKMADNYGYKLVSKRG